LEAFWNPWPQGYVGGGGGIPASLTFVINGGKSSQNGGKVELFFGAYVMPCPARALWNPGRIGRSSRRELVYPDPSAFFFFAVLLGIYSTKKVQRTSNIAFLLSAKKKKRTFA